MIKKISDVTEAVPVIGSENGIGNLCPKLGHGYFHSLQTTALGNIKNPTFFLPVINKFF